MQSDTISAHYLAEQYLYDSLEQGLDLFERELVHPWRPDGCLRSHLFTITEMDYLEVDDLLRQCDANTTPRICAIVSQRLADERKGA